MSQNVIMSEQLFYACGVIKVDYTNAGFKDLKEVASQRANDPCFYHLVVRAVSKENYGIQFMYCSPIEEWKNQSIHYKNAENKFYATYITPLRENYGLYAHDIEFNNTTNKELAERVLIQKPYI